MESNCSSVTPQVCGIDLAGQIGEDVAHARLPAQTTWSSTIVAMTVAEIGLLTEPTWN